VPLAPGSVWRVAGRAKAKRRRKRRLASPAPTPEQTVAAPAEKRTKDDIAREQLVPLRQGERPLAVTIGAVIATALGASTVVLFVVGVDTGSGNTSTPGTLVYAALMLTMAWGMWRARYWAVLGLQVLLAMLILVWSIFLVRAENVLGAIVAVAIIGAAGALFWFLVKALARLQMPERRPPSGGR
jgi:hypothetical protein